MNSPDYILDLLRETALFCGDGELAVLEPGAAWRLALPDDGPRFDIELAARQEMLVVASAVGLLPEERRGHICAMLLRYNYLWKTTGGVRMALDGSGERVVMMLEVPLAALGAHGLYEILKNLAEVHVTWQALLT